MNPDPAIESDMIVQRLLDLWPQTARVFLDHRMSCVGCPVAAFETIEEVARIYEQDSGRLLHALRQCAEAGDTLAEMECDTGDWELENNDEH
jgi:hybrid cluster-associated redox disulfide protein